MPSVGRLLHTMLLMGCLACSPAASTVDSGTRPTAHDDAGDGSMTDASATLAPDAAPDPGDAGPRIGAPAAWRNPVLGGGCPDPGVTAVDGDGYYMVCTSSRGFPIWRSVDLTSWEDTGAKIFPDTRPTWAVSHFWAPEIHRVGERFVAYFTARNGPEGRLCIGAASAPEILGPYEDIGGPLACNDDVSLIDPSFFRDRDGAQYLLYKTNGNALSPRQPTWIVAQELAEDGLSLTGAPVRLLRDSLSWEGQLIEAPWMIRRGDRYYLFYSGNLWSTGRYATGVARATSPLGPFEKHAQPILVSSASWLGPGHGSIVSTPAGEHYVYHAWRPSASDSAAPDRDAGRHVLLDRVWWDVAWPRIWDGRPSHVEQPASPYPNECGIRCCDEALLREETASEDECRSLESFCDDHRGAVRIRYEGVVVYSRAC